jgi:hypothetical protein
MVPGRYYSGAAHYRIYSDPQVDSKAISIVPAHDHPPNRPACCAESGAQPKNFGWTACCGVSGTLCARPAGRDE